MILELPEESKAVEVDMFEADIETHDSLLPVTAGLVYGHLYDKRREVISVYS